MSILKNNLRASGSSVCSGERSTNSKIINWVCATLFAALILFGGNAKAIDPYNVLVNPGAEQGLTGWNVSETGYISTPNTNSVIPNDTAPGATNYLAHSGTNTFQLFDATANSAIIYQDYPAAAGSQWTASCWAICYASNYFDSAFTYMSVAFYDTNGMLLGASFDSGSGGYPAPFQQYGYGVYASVVLDPIYLFAPYIIAPPPAVDASGWMYLPATNFWFDYMGATATNAPGTNIETSASTPISVSTLTAPPGTAFVRYQLEYDNSSTDGGAVCFDDCQLNKLNQTDPDLTNPQPASVTIMQGESASFTVNALSDLRNNSGGHLKAEDLFYQWQKNGTNLPVAGGNIQGFTTNAFLFLTNCQSANSGMYSCLVFDSPVGNGLPTGGVTNYIRTVPVPLTVVPLYPTVYSGTQWNIIWSDEFNGTNINTKNWAFELGGGPGGNKELEYYTSNPQNAYVSNGLLHIVALQQSMGGFNYTSARMKTEGLRNTPIYGRFVWRAALPAGVGMWPALWMLGWDYPIVGWPACGEIDVVENNGAAPTWVQGSYHASGNDQTAKYYFPTGGSTTNYHTYMLDWETNSIRWYVDGQLYENRSSQAPFNAPFFLIMNLAVGGQYLGNPTTNAINAGTVFPASMLVDYVRIYEPTAPLAFSVGPQSNGSSTLSWPTNIVCHLQIQTNSLTGTWFDTSVTTSPFVVSPNPSNTCVFYRLQSP